MKFAELKLFDKFIHNNITYIRFSTSYFHGNSIVVKPYQDINYKTFHNNDEVTLLKEENDKN